MSHQATALRPLTFPVSVSVCLSVCVSVCHAPYLKNGWTDFNQIFTKSWKLRWDLGKLELASYIEYSRLNLNFRVKRKSFITPKDNVRSC